MKKKILLVATGLLLALALAGCHQHEWVEATCTEPKHCTGCDETEGEALGHQWEDATCEDPKTCSVCGETEGEALGHEWMDATCTDPKTCSVCGQTEGEVLDHEWKDATCVDPKTCSLCGETEGEPDIDAHDWMDATCTEPKTCSLCGATEGEALGHQYEDGVCTVCGEESPVVAATYETLEDHKGERASFDIVVYDTSFTSYTCRFHALTYDGINYINPFVGYDIQWSSSTEFFSELESIKDGDILTITYDVPTYYSKYNSIQSFDILYAEITGTTDINEVFSAAYANTPAMDYESYMRNTPTYGTPYRITGTISYIDGSDLFVETASGRVVVQDMNRDDEDCLEGDTIDVVGQTYGYKDWITAANGKLPKVEGILITRV